MIAKPPPPKKLSEIRKAWVEEIQKAQIDYMQKIFDFEINGDMADSLMLQINACAGIIRGATDNSHKAAAEPAYENFRGLCAQLDLAIAKKAELEKYKKIPDKEIGKYFDDRNKWDGDDLNMLYRTYKESKKSLKVSNFKFKDGKFEEKIRIISFEDFSKYAPPSLTIFIKHLYVTFFNEKCHELIIDNRNQDQKIFGTLNSPLPGAMRSQHMNQSGALPDISKTPVPKYMQPLDDYIATFSGVPNNVADKGSSVGYVEYTAPGMSKHEGRVVFDYKQGKVYVNASHYGYFHREGPKDKRALVESGQVRDGKFTATEDHGNQKNPFFLILPPK